MMLLRQSALIAMLLFGSTACSSSSFETGESDPGNDTGTDTLAVDSSTTDSTSKDTATSDSTTPEVNADAAEAEVTAEAGCSAGMTDPCECGGARVCLTGGIWSECKNKCPVSPSRFICAFGHDGCKAADCFDSNNCPGKCGCDGAPGSTCALSDPCWGFVCNGYVCPS